MHAFFADIRGSTGSPRPCDRMSIGPCWTVSLGATVFGSLDAIVHRGGQEVASVVAIGVAVSVLPILTRVLPPLVGEAHADGRRSISAVAAIGGWCSMSSPWVGLVVVLNR